VRETVDLESDGLMTVPSGPGLGITVVPEAVEHYRKSLTVVV